MNPKTLKRQTVKLSFVLVKPSLTNATNVCPYFDFQVTNPRYITKNYTDDTYLVTLTNNFSNIILTYPSVRVTCGSTKYSLLAMYIQDETGFLMNQSAYLSTFPTVNAGRTS